MKLTEEEIENWKQLRTRTLGMFIAKQTLIGMEISLTITTLWLYLKEQVPTDRPVFFYSLVTTAFTITALLFSGVIGNAVDKNRRVRRTFFIVNTFAVVGNVLYSLPFSPWFLVVGRLMSGVVGPFRSVMAGEVGRSYRPSELAGKMSYMAGGYLLGFTLGPALNVLFTKVDTSIGSLRITYTNIPGFLMAFLFAGVTIAGNCFLSDLSKIYDLKKETIETSVSDDVTRENDITDDMITESDIYEEDSTKELLTQNQRFPESDATSEKNQSTSSTWRKVLFSNADVTLLLVLSFVHNYIEVSITLWLPLLVVEKLQWTVVANDVIMIGIALFSLGASLLVGRYCASDAQLFYIAVATPCAFIATYVVMEVFFHRATSSLPLLATLWVLFAFLTAISMVSMEVFIVATLAKMVCSRHQMFADTLRFTVYRWGGLLAMATSPVLFRYLDVLFPVHGAIIFVLGLMLVIRRKSFQNPEIVIT